MAMQNALGGDKAEQRAQLLKEQDKIISQVQSTLSRTQLTSQLSQGRTARNVQETGLKTSMQEHRDLHTLVSISCHRPKTPLGGGCRRPAQLGQLVGLNSSTASQQSKQTNQHLISKKSR